MIDTTDFELVNRFHGVMLGGGEIDTFTYRAVVTCTDDTGIDAVLLGYVGVVAGDGCANVCGGVNG